MTRLCLILIVLFAAINVYSQNIKIFSLQEGEANVLYASSSEYMPVSVSFEFNLDNMKFSEKTDKIFVVPAKAGNFRIGSIAVVDTKLKWKFSYTYRTTEGDVTKVNYDKNYSYHLPFEKGNSFKVFQGYNGTVSHQNENALDFNMPEGTKILAAREGVVVQIVQNNTGSCPRKECEQYNNYITIMHSDGTYASYVHIQNNGAQVKLGDTVRKNQVIALSGNVGYSSGPHLHFICFVPGFDKRVSVKTLFAIANGDKKEILKENRTYSRNY